jgi:hypothetical protein
MKRLVVFLSALFAAVPAYALPVGGPGHALDHEDKTFAITGGVGYNYRFVEGESFKGQDKQDDQTSFRFLVRGEVAVLPWITPMVTVGLADRTRDLTEFDGTLGPLVGLGLRIDPLIQRGDSGIGLGIVTQASYEKSTGNGLSTTPVDPFVDPENFTYAEQSQTADTWHAEVSLLLSRKDGRITLYGGPKLDWDRTIYTKRSEEVEPILPIGVVIGVDYDITPEVFFSAEMENFHQDAIYGMVGARF